ncbi:MAG: hypothetical protein WD871_02770 [Xanthobacteraceae bacterium]
MARPVEPNPSFEREQTNAGDESDRVELWGRRIGRALGWIVAAFLIFQLLRTYGT